MAQIVCVKFAKEGLNNVGDVISIHDDDVELSGPGYALADILPVKGMAASEIRTKFRTLIPEQKTVVVDKVEKQAWRANDGTWNLLEKHPKYMMNIGSLTKEDRQTLVDNNSSRANKDNIVSSKFRDNISSNSANLTKVPM